MAFIGNLLEIGSGINGRAYNRTLYVSPNGANTNGLTWKAAFNQVQDALDAASVDPGDCTLILIAPHATNYDINKEGDPTWAGNYILKGSHRNWAKIKNDHASADSIMKFAGKIAVEDLNINLGTGTNGLIFTSGGFRVDCCMIVGSDLTSPATAIHVDGAAQVKNGKIRGCDIKGEVTSVNMLGVLLDNAECTEIKDTRIGFCSSGLQQVGANSALNKMSDAEFCTCAIGANIDAGTAMSFDDMLFYNNDLNIDDEVGGHLFNGIRGEFPISLEPETLVGVTVTAGNKIWGADTEVRMAATATKPFKVVAYTAQPSHDENMMIRLSADSGTTFFTQNIFASKKNKATGSGDATDFIFNAGTRISASILANDAGRDMDIWLEIQEL